VLCGVVNLQLLQKLQRGRFRKHIIVLYTCIAKVCKYVYSLIDEVSYLTSKLSILTLHYIAISSVSCSCTIYSYVVGLYGVSELWMGHHSKSR